jgi:opacity protein-like surface antigen
MMGVSRSTFDTSKVTNYSAAVGVERAVHELWSVVADVGVRYTRSEFDVITNTEDDFGWTANVSALYKGETTSGSLTLYHDVAAAPGLGSAVQRSAAVLEARQRTTWELTPFFSAGYYLNRADAGQFSTRSIDERTVRVRPGLRYDATRNILIEAAYQYTRLTNSEADTTASQSVVYLMATLRYPLYE